MQAVGCASIVFSRFCCDDVLSVTRLLEWQITRTIRVPAKHLPEHTPLSRSATSLITHANVSREPADSSVTVTEVKLISVLQDLDCEYILCHAGFVHSRNDRYDSPLVLILSSDTAYCPLPLQLLTSMHVVAM